MLKYFRYPQYAWAKNAIQILQKHSSASQLQTFVDLPCGDGIFTYWLKKKWKNKTFIAIDIEAEKTKIASNTNAQIIVKTQDIFEYQFDTDQCVWFLINSLYLLPDTNRLFHEKQIHPRFLLTVTPNIEAANYKYFKKRNPQFNISEMSQSATTQFFLKHGYEVLEQRSVTAFPYFFYFSIPGLKYLFNVIFILFDRARNGSGLSQYDMTLYRKIAVS
jgi:trans-aconitate methyltransferase